MNISYEDFLDITDGYAVVDFWAEWCGPCEVFGPIFNEVSDMYPQIKFIKIDIDKNQNLCEDMGIMSIPTIHFYSDSMLNSELIGGTSKNEFIKFIDENINSLT